MTQNDKDLLLKDLCSRLPYGVKCQIKEFGEKLFTLKSVNIDYKNGHLLTFEEKINNLPVEVYLSEVKPCLFSLSTMTDEQKKELLSLMTQDSYGILYHTIESYGYLIENHFDIYGSY